MNTKFYMVILIVLGALVACLPTPDPNQLAVEQSLRNEKRVLQGEHLKRQDCSQEEQEKNPGACRREKK